MKNGISISGKDLIWNYLASFFKIASSAVLLPFILRELPAEAIGLWTVYLTITTFSTILDFGFNPTFTRNVTYIFSGIQKLRKEGFEEAEASCEVNYSLLKDLIRSMRAIYRRMGLVLLLFLSGIGSFYISVLAENYTGNVNEVYISWAILVALNSYNILTSYYESLLLGKGLVKKSKQIIIVSHMAYIILAIIMIYLDYGLIAIVSAQAAAIVINRLLSHRAFFNRAIKDELAKVSHSKQTDIFKAVYPNALKVGLTTLGGFLIQRSSLIIGSLYLTLEEIASYGISVQIITVLATMAAIFLNTYQPLITQYQVTGRQDKIKELYLTGTIIMMLTFLAGGFAILFLAQPLLSLTGSNTNLMPLPLLLFAIILFFEQTNLMLAGNIILTRNRVPFFKASLISGLIIIIGLVVSFRIADYGLLNLLFIPFMVDMAYQAWKWPCMVVKELGINLHDVVYSLRQIRTAISLFFKP
jgi:O-antigen/teichoic acid export membrane protein